jgi:hypothetical protein
MIAAEQPEAATLKRPKLPFKWLKKWLQLIFWAFAILLLYVLSFGPVVRMWDSTPFNEPNPLIYGFYTPLIWIYDHTAFHKPFGMYLHLWDPVMYDKNGNGRMAQSTGASWPR